MTPPKQVPEQPDQWGQIRSQWKQIEDQWRQIGEQRKQAVDQWRQIEDQRMQDIDQWFQIDDQWKQIGEQQKLLAQAQTPKLAAALTKSGNCLDLPRKLLAFSNESPDLSNNAVSLKVLEDLIAIRESSSSSFKTDLPNFVKALLAIARASETKGCVRLMAVEVLLCIVEDEVIRPCLSAPEFASELVHILLELNFKDDIAELDANTTKKLYFNMSGEGLERVASQIGEENVKKFIFGCILEYLKKDEVQFKQVAMMAIAVTVEYLPREGIDTLLGEVMELVMVQLTNQHQDIRFLTCEAIHQIVEKYHGLFQKTYAKAILPLLVNLFDDPISVVQLHAVSAFIVIAKGTEAADLMLCADKVMDKFLELITPENPGTMRKHCLEGIAVVASIIKKKFMKFYSLVVPVVTRIIVASSNKEEKAIRGKAIKCINTINEAVGDEMVQADAHEVMQALLQIDAAGLEADDPLKKYINETFCQMCRSLKGEFAPYLPQLIPNLLKVLSIEHQPDNHKEDEATVDGKLIELKKLELREITQAVDLLSTCIEVFGAKFGEYFIPAAQSLLSLLSSQVFVNVKIEAMAAMAKVFTVARESSDPATRQLLNQGVKALLETVFEDLNPCDKAYSHFDFAPTIAEARTAGLTRCLFTAGPDVLNAQQVETICENVLRLMKESNQRRGKIDAEEDEEDDLEQVLFVAHLTLMGTVMKFHADLYLQTGAELCRKFIETHLDSNCIPNDRALALYVFVNVLEFLKDKSAPLWPTFASRLVECINDPDPGVRKAAAYGVIQAAKCPQFPAELIEKAAAQLFALISAEQSQKEAFLSAKETVIAALGTIIVHRKSCLQPSPEQFLNLWISNLPLKVDCEEGCRTHGDFVDLLVQKSPEVLGPQNANLPKMAAICSFIYRTNFTTKKTDEEIRDFVQKIGVDVISSFDEKLQKDLKKIQRDE